MRRETIIERCLADFCVYTYLGEDLYPSGDKPRQPTTLVEGGSAMAWVQAQTNSIAALLMYNGRLPTMSLEQTQHILLATDEQIKEDAYKAILGGNPQLRDKFEETSLTPKLFMQNVEAEYTMLNPGPGPAPTPTTPAPGLDAAALQQLSETHRLTPHLLSLRRGVLVDPTPP